MPIYDYHCSACARITEVVHGINDSGPKFCPECGAEGTMTKGFTTPAIHFKGSGWAKKDRSASSASKTSSTTSTEASDGAPAAKSDDTNGASTTPATPASTPKSDKAPATSASTD
jgi:putative FmdB family regulatory protein